MRLRRQIAIIFTEDFRRPDNRWDDDEARSGEAPVDDYHENEREERLGRTVVAAVAARTMLIVLIALSA